MKPKFVITSLLTAALALGATATMQKPSQAANTSFNCGVWLNGPNAGTPVTYARTPRGIVPIVNWVSEHFSGSGYTPMRRCMEVSGRFQTAYNNGTLKFVTSGIRNGQPVICTSSANGGPCSSVLFTLKPGSDASRTLQSIFNIQMMGAAAPPLYESEASTYIDVNAVLDSAQTVDATQIDGANGSSTPAAQPQPSAPSVSEPTSPAPAGGGGPLW